MRTTKTDYSIAELQAKAESMCARAEYSKADIIDRLYRWGCRDKESINTIVSSLVEQGYVDNERYALAFVHDKLLYQGWGKQKMRMMLSLKHIPDEVISLALSRIDPQDYDRKLREAINTKLSSLAADDANLTEKVVRFCVQRGFDYEDIRRVIGSAD